eukprot:CAMPEP_0204446878 /NCGR_PEP_ID=MMETSP0470-20130426/95464_1 /ASSEMBLY_ACC=CAM_ASM_000385 /TAXON_ID=2969 /ORGANISM="Oxyrrhis marina" /LENGTH=85 /DNA_ID=CAMNT_0051446491 /DNA_START=194 /DNA_END=448 /DNA_ORIENTATION=-
MTVVGWKTSSLATRNTVGPHYVGRQSRISLGLEVQQRLRGPSWAATTVPVAPSLAPDATTDALLELGHAPSRGLDAGGAGGGAVG